jgi:ubiquinone/menaquinone biosynthesis C-methylase UbiE
MPQNRTKRTDNQEFYYETLFGRLLGSKAREHLIEKEFSKIKKGQRFLEVGCAQGYYLSRALKKTKNVFGMDIIPEFIDAAKKTGAKVAVASAEKLPYKDKSFDFVLCTETLEHVPNWKKAVDEIKRVLKPKGKAIITVPLEKSGFWKFFSIFCDPEKTRGHISLVTATDIEKAFVPMKMKERKFVQTMSESLNKVLPQSEGISIYCFFVFEK